MKKITVCILSLFIATSAFSATTVSLKLSGEGAKNDSTIIAGKKVSVDVYLENEGNFKGVTLGFKIFSDNIKKISHPSDPGNGLNKQGDVKGHNGWQGTTTWDMMNGLFVNETNWDGTLPDLLGVGGFSKTAVYTPHKFEKKLSFEILVNETGTIVIDSAFYKPAGRWMFAPPSTVPEWNGPYSFKVIK